MMMSSAFSRQDFDFKQCPLLTSHDPAYVELGYRVRTEDFAERCKRQGEDGARHLDWNWYLQPRVWYGQALSLSEYINFAQVFTNKRLMNQIDISEFDNSVPKRSISLPPTATEGMVNMYFSGRTVYAQTCRNHTDQSRYQLLCTPSGIQYSTGLGLARQSKVEMSIIMTDNMTYVLQVFCVNGLFRQYVLRSVEASISRLTMRQVRHRIAEEGFNMRWFRVKNNSTCN